MHSPKPKIDYTELSREISYALRHAPEKYGLTLDEEGWAELEVLLAALRKQEAYNTLSPQDIADMIECSAKKRHEIMDGRIRALYGHSVAAEIKKEPVRPPAVLYHGTAKRFLSAILEQGLKPMKRQYVHLAEEKDIATEAGKRRDEEPVILCVDAAAAWESGIRFFHGNENIWLADSLPAVYLSLETDFEEE